MITTTPPIRNTEDRARRSTAGCGLHALGDGRRCSGRSPRASGSGRPRGPPAPKRTSPCARRRPDPWPWLPWAKDSQRPAGGAAAGSGRSGTIVAPWDARVLVIDNYDSFVYNLVQELGELGAEPVVHRNDAIDVDGHPGRPPRRRPHLAGPGRPEDAGVSLEVIEQLAGEIPILGVCLGHQCIGQVYGGEIVAAPTSCTARPRRSTTTGAGSSPGCPTPSWPPATTRSSCGPSRCPTSWR